MLFLLQVGTCSIDAQWAQRIDLIPVCVLLERNWCFYTPAPPELRKGALCSTAVHLARPRYPCIRSKEVTLPGATS